MRLFRFRRVVNALVAALCFLAVSPTTAQTVGLSLAQSSNCLSCHQVDRKVVGPGFKVIAERFKGNPDAVDYLVHSILMGSRGRWGAVPMPRQTQVSEADARLLAQWILSLNNEGASSGALVKEPAVN